MPLWVQNPTRETVGRVGLVGGKGTSALGTGVNCRAGLHKWGWSHTVCRQVPIKGCKVTGRFSFREKVVQLGRVPIMEISHFSLKLLSSGGGKAKLACLQDLACRNSSGGVETRDTLSCAPPPPANRPRAAAWTKNLQLIRHLQKDISAMQKGYPQPNTHNSGHQVPAAFARFPWW